MKPTEEDIRKWHEIAQRRSAILPIQFEFISKRDISVICGSCENSFIRPLITGQNDPVYVCPKCSKRNYIPIDWNVQRKH